MDEFVELQRDNNRFQILNGNWLEGYPLSKQKKEQIDNEWKLDRSGEFFVIKEGKNYSYPKASPKERGKLFYTNAFLFWEKREYIFSDSRMFLAPVPVENGLAYTGTHGFLWPTLGVYLEWWENCEESHLLLEDGERLIWFISGSPLSGANLCASVGKDGMERTTPVHPFLPVWKGFRRINVRYDEVKMQYDAYTLEQVVQALQ